MDPVGGRVVPIRTARKSQRGDIGWLYGDVMREGPTNPSMGFLEFGLKMVTSTIKW